MKITPSSTWIFGSLILSLTIAKVVNAQIVPDNTLPNPSSVQTGCTACTINGGTTRGTNLFHSFREFSVPTGGRAFFNNAPQIQNILTRVTGNSVSNIDGLIGANANLFFINPNGILFGPNASLNIGGSFVASTANAIAFPNGETFSATNPTPPNPLLTIKPNALLVNQLNPQPIINRSTANSTGLKVNNGRSLLLVGGDVKLEGGQLAASSGRIELGGLSEPGAIGLAVNGNLFSLEFPINVRRADVSVIRSLMDVVAGGGGSIAITAQNLNVLNGSLITAGIGTGLGTVGSQAGDIDLNATGAIAINRSGIGNRVLDDAIGKGGNIRITAESFLLTNGAQLAADTNGQGNAGSIFINARDTVFLNGTRPNGGSGTGIFSNVAENGIGQGGNIHITAGSLSLTNGASLSTITFGQGNSGSILIDARDTVSFDGVGPGGITPTYAFSSVQRSGRGRGGDIRINARFLSVTNGAQVGAGTRGQGDSGNVLINASDAVFFDRSLAASSVEQTAVGQGGSIYISTGSLFLINGAQLVSGTRGQGDAGSVSVNARNILFSGTQITPINNASPEGIGPSGVISSVRGTGKGGDIHITTDALSVTNGAQLVASTIGRGIAGTISINARDTVSFDGIDPTGRRASGAYSSVQPGGVGQGGTIRITTGTLSMTNGARLVVSTFGRGNAGNIFIDARDTVSFADSNGSVATAAFSSVGAGGTGRGGNIYITTKSFSLTNGGQLVANTFGRGDAGNIFVDARSSISFNGRSPNGEFSSGSFSRVNPEAIGKGGDITLITADSLTVTNGATISASSSGTGGAGNISVNAPNLRLDQARITSETASGNGGNINLTVQDILLLRRGSLISTTAGNARSRGDGGNIRFNGGFIITVPSENSDITANAFTGSGGRVDITTQGIFGIGFRPRLTPLSDITASSEFGIAGVVAITTPDVDPSRGLTELPTDLTDASNQIAIGCSPTTTAQTNRGEFYQTGRSGIAPLPTDTLGSSDILEDLRLPNAWTAKTKPAPIIEAQDWQINERGEVILVASKQQKPCEYRNP